jgi:hypothetical protein
MSPFSTADPLLLAITQRLGMDDVYRVIVINHEHDLHESTTIPTAPHKPLVFALPLRVRRFGVANNLFGFVRRYAMLWDMVQIPFVPSKVH